MTSPISISLVISDNYSQHLAVFAASVLENNPHSEFIFHILHRNVSWTNRAKIKKLETLYPNQCRIVFHFVDIGEVVNFPIPTELDHVSVETYFRYMLPDVIQDESRTIFSDVDVLCQGEIEDLWNLDLKCNPIAAVRDNHIDEDVKRHNLEIGLSANAPYYHAGLLVMDLDMMRKENSARMLFDVTYRLSGIKNFACDMDGINAVFAGRITDISEKFNSCDKYSAKRKDVVIWHFPGVVAKPWCNIPKNRSWLVYLKYLRKSPYRGNSFRFVLEHLLGFVYFSYLKNGIRRYLVFGIRVYKRREK